MSTSAATAVPRRRERALLPCQTRLSRTSAAAPPAPVLPHPNAGLLSPHTADNFTDAAVGNRINGEHKEKDLEPWEGGEANNSDSLESLDTDVVGLRRGSPLWAALLPNV